MKKVRRVWVLSDGTRNIVCWSRRQARDLKTVFERVIPATLTWTEPKPKRGKRA